ncbi:hypothetical protein [Streptomyces sp. NPDC127038]|uniref:hypothetical protein n=1 Tax=Streptomyces sp. NPDC127038 TaxID=3347114 RepID=UPI0036649F95
MRRSRLVLVVLDRVRPCNGRRPWPQPTFASLRASTGADTRYRRRREQGDWNAAQRNFFNRMIGQLHHCQQKRELFDERSAFPTASCPPAEAAAA